MAASAGEMQAKRERKLSQPWRVHSRGNDGSVNRDFFIAKMANYIRGRGNSWKNCNARGTSHAHSNPQAKTRVFGFCFVFPPA